MQSKQISNKSLSAVNSLSGAVTMSIQYDDDVYTNSGQQRILQTPKVAQVELMEEPIIKDNINSLEGELMIQKAGVSIPFVDNNGDFYISDEDADLYEINDNGELIFNQY